MALKQRVFGEIMRRVVRVREANVKRVLSTICVGALGFLALTGAAAACNGQTVLYEDDFTSADPAWGDYDGQKIAGGKLTVSPAQYAGYAIQNQTGFFTDFDVCVDVVQKNSDPTTGYAGILFWGTDYDNFYTFDVATNGYVRVSRKQNTRWLTPVAWVTVPGVKAGTDVNQVRVVVVGNQATLFVNGAQAAAFKGQPPQGGGLIGVYAASPKDSTGIYDFDNFKVTDVVADGGQNSGGGQGGSTPPAGAPSEPGIPKTP